MILDNGFLIYLKNHLFIQSHRKRSINLKIAKKQFFAVKVKKLFVLEMENS